MLRFWTKALFVMSLIAAASMFAVPASAQQKCTDEAIVGTATGKDQPTGVREADRVWVKEATAKLGTKDVFHLNPRAKCTAAKGKGDYTCTMTAKACDQPDRSASARRSQCWGSGIEICCRGFDGKIRCVADVK